MIAGAAPENSAWRDRTAWLTAAVGAAIAAICAAPANSWLDSAELTACAAELGNVHPPGHPAWLSLSQLVRFLPLGPFPWRIAIFSALATGAALFLLVRLVRAQFAAHGSRALTSAWALLAAGTLLSSGSLWQVAVRAEVYTLALATNIWALHAALIAGQIARRPNVDVRLITGYLAAWTMAICLGLLNHHYVAIFALPASLFAAWPAITWLLKRHRRVALALVLGGAWLGLGYLALGLRSHADTEMRWGDPSTVAGLWDTLTAKHFQKNLTQIHVDYVDNALVLFGMIAEGLSLPLAGLGGLGLAFAVLWRDRLQGVLWLAFLGGLATKAVLQIDTRNPDDHGYVLMAPTVLAIGAGQLGAFIAGRRGLLADWPETRRLRVVQVSVVVGLCLVVGQVSTLLERPETNLAGMRAADAVDAQVRNALPPGAIYLTNYYGLAFNEQAFRIAEGRRPDIAAPHLSFRTGDTDHGAAWQAWFGRRRPELADLPQAAHALGRAPVGNLLARVETQPVYAEQDPELRIPAGVYGFDGVASRLLPQKERSLDYDLTAIAQKHQATWMALDRAMGVGSLQDGPTRAVLLWQHALQAAHALRRGWVVVADAELQRAQMLSPQDRLLATLRGKLQQLTDAMHSGDATRFRELWQNWQMQDFTALAVTEAGHGTE
jgi:hypothetical protein